MFQSTGADNYAVNSSEALGSIKCEANSSRFININFTMIYAQTNESMVLNLTTSGGFTLLHISPNSSYDLRKLFLLGTAYRNKAITTVLGDKKVHYRNDNTEHATRVEFDVGEKKVLGEKTIINGSATCSIIAFGNITGFKYILDSEVEANYTDEAGMAPLHYAAMFGDVDVIKQLESKGANVSVRWTDVGATPLHFAVVRGDRDIIRQLVHLGADPNAVDNNGMCVLSSAVIANQSQAVEELINLGANLTYFINRTSNPLHMATERGYRHIIKLLIESGMNIDIRNPRGVTALDLAIEAFDRETVGLLVHSGVYFKTKELKRGYGSDRIEDLMPNNYTSYSS